MTVVEERVVNERKDVTARAHYPEPVSLAGMICTFWMRALGASTYKVAGAAASFEDISDQYGLEAERVWEHRFTPGALDFDTEGRYDFKFRQDYGSSRYQYIPEGMEWGRLVIIGPEPLTGA